MAESQVLKRLEFPAYCIRVLDNGLVAIAGGGGTSKTGVGNLIEIGIIDYKIQNAVNNNSNERDGIAQFKSISKFEPEDAIMKFVSFTNGRQNSSASNKTSNTPENVNGKMPKGNLDQGKKIPITRNADDRKSSCDVYLAAAVNDTIEIYKLTPKLDKSHNESNNINCNETSATLDKSQLKNRKGIYFKFKYF